MSIILSDKNSHIVGAAYPDGSDMTDTNWCSKYTVIQFDRTNGVTLPAGFLLDCFTYSAGVWAIVPGKEAYVAGQLLMPVTTPILASGDVIPGPSILSDGVTLVSLIVTVRAVYQATSYEIRYFRSATADYMFKSVIMPGAVQIDGLAVNTEYSISVRSIGQWGISAWSATVLKSTSPNLPTSLMVTAQNASQVTTIIGNTITTSFINTLEITSKSIKTAGAGNVRLEIDPTTQRLTWYRADNSVRGVIEASGTTAALRCESATGVTFAAINTGSDPALGGYANTGIAVLGMSTSDVGITGMGGTYGGIFQCGTKGAILLGPASYAPASPTVGSMYYDSTLDQFRGYTTSGWVTLG